MSLSVAQHGFLGTALHTIVAAACVATAVPVGAQQQARSPAAEIAHIKLPLRTTSTAPGPAAGGPGSTMVTQVYKPPGTGPFPVLLYAHGRAAYASQRAVLKRPIHERHVRYWLARGYAVVAPIRPGYGATGGADQESSGVGYSATGQCLRQPNPAPAVVGAVHAQQQALSWVGQQPWARQDHIVLEGLSVGGLATIALCASNPPGVRGCINFSGGAGGDPVHAPGRMCAPEKITELMREYGRSTRVPSIWLYAPNDLYWGAAAPRAWHGAFTQAAHDARSAGNAQHPSQAATPTAATSTLVITPPIGSDGHSLQRAGSRLWRPALNAWLRQYGL